MSFVDRFGLWSEAQQQAARDVVAALEQGAIEVVRFSFPDQHGILRGKTLVASEAIGALKSGVTITTTMFAKDTSHRTVFPVFTSGGGFSRPEMQGAADVLMVADPLTFKVLPWAPNTGWVLCDTYFQSGVPVPFDTRQLFRKVLGGLADTGFELVTGLEVECHVFKVAQHHMLPQDAGQPGRPGMPPDVELMSHGYQYLTEIRYDAMDEVMELVRKTAQGLELPLRSLEVEFGPSQFEFTFAPGQALKTADDMILFRSAVKQVCRRHGFHATFMCRPRIPNVVSSGWHLHQSLRSLADGRNAFVPTEGGAGSVRHGPPLSWRAAGARLRRGGAVHADAERLQALPAVFAGAGPRDLGQGQPRRDAARARRGGRPRYAHRESRGRAGGESVSVFRFAGAVRHGRPGAAHRSGAVGRRAL